MRASIDTHSTWSYRWLAAFSLGLLLLLQACDSGNSNFNNNSTKGGSGNIGVNNAAFTGNILFVKSGNLFILHGKDDSLTQLTQDGTAFQPAISPDGATIAFELRRAGSDYSDIATMPIAGGKATRITDNSLHNKSTGAPYHYLFWAANPIWTANGKNIIYLSDFFKGGDTTPFSNPTCTGLSSKDWILDMGIVELPASARPVAGGQLNRPPKQLSWPYCYAGGDQDLSLRPGVSDTEILFTSFQYVGSNLDLALRLSLLVIPANGGDSKVIQLSPADPKIAILDPSFSPDGKSITYIRRENGQDDLYIMPVDAKITGTPNNESYNLIGGGTSTYYTNTTYFQHSQKLLSATATQPYLSQPVWGGANTIFFEESTSADINGGFNLFMAKMKITTPAPAATATPAPGVTPTPTATPAPVIALDGKPIQLTQGGLDCINGSPSPQCRSRPVWFS